jgi:ATP-dependent 26S proteasome regulatory subunit
MWGCGPLTEKGLSQKHGVMPPKTINFFGPPGTGKTHFVRAVAGILSGWYIEIAPSVLMADGLEKIGVNLRSVMEKSRNLDEAVLQKISPVNLKSVIGENC